MAIVKRDKRITQKQREELSRIANGAAIQIADVLAQKIALEIILAFNRGEKFAKKNFKGKDCILAHAKESAEAEIARWKALTDAIR